MITRTLNGMECQCGHQGIRGHRSSTQYAHIVREELDLRIKGNLMPELVRRSIKKILGGRGDVLRHSPLPQPKATQPSLLWVFEGLDQMRVQPLHQLEWLVQIRPLIEEKLPNVIWNASPHLRAYYRYIHTRKSG